MFFFNFPDKPQVVDRVLNRGGLPMGHVANIDCANVMVGQKVLRLVSMNSFFDIVGIAHRAKSPLDSFCRLLNHPVIRTAASDRLLERFRTGYSLDLKSDGPIFVDCRVVTDFCRLILSLREYGKIGEPYLRYAQNCEKFMVGLADTGLVALIDEATGYAKKRRDEYQQLFLAFIREERSDWVKEFPDSFFSGIYKIYNLEKIGRNHPQFFGGFIAKYVYWPLADSKGAILEKLREKDPYVKVGTRRYKLHQFLTQKIGKPALHDHLVRIGLLLDMSKNKNDFRRQFQKAFPRAGDQMEFDFGDDI